MEYFFLISGIFTTVLISGSIYKRNEKGIKISNFELLGSLYVMLIFGFVIGSLFQ